MLSDIRFALRSLAKAPGFTAVAVLTLAVGIAATASLFTVVSGLLRDPLPYPDSGRLVQVWRKNVDATLDFTPLSTPDYLDLQERAPIFSALGAFSVQRFNLGGDRPEAIEGAACTPDLFRALNVPPLHGRWFTRDDEAGHATAVVILSHALWQQRFASDPACIGRTLRLDGRDHTIVGIMPANFVLLSAWTRERSLGIWTLLSLKRDRGGRNNFWLGSIARLAPGVTAAQADDELKTIARQIVATDSEASPRRTFWQLSLAAQIGGLPAIRVSVLLGAGWTLLCLAAQNVAGMLLARGISRQPEMAVRIALGARRGHILRLVAAEGVLLSVAASALAFLLTVWCMDGLSGLLPPEVMPRGGLKIDGSLLLCMIGLTAVSAQMAGLAPALLAAKADVMGNLKDGGVNATAARRTQRKLRSLVIGQIALALFLVSVAVQLSATYRDMLASSHRLLSDRVLSAAVAVKGAAYRDDAARVVFWNRLLEATAALPGVRDTGVTTKLPFDGGVSMTALVDDEAYNPADPGVFIEVSYVSPGFFSTLDVPLLQGRYLSHDDSLSRHKSVVVNRAFARRYWPGGNPLGHRVRPNQAGSAWTAEVVGVIEDVRQTPERPARPEMYFPYSDAPNAQAFLLVRTAPGIAPPTEALRHELHRLDSDLALAGVTTLETFFTKQSRVLVVITSLVDALSIAILALAALGLYGTLSFYFAQRRREIGVRIALGASTRDILRLAFRQAAGWVLTGLAVGATGTVLLALALRAALRDASALQPGQLALCAAVVIAAAALAAWLPARRATRIDPIEALRAE